MTKNKKAPENKTIRDSLSPLEECCVQNYVANGGDQSKAYRACHKTAKNWKNETVHVKASVLFSHDKVRVRVKEVQDTYKDKYAITTDILLREMAILALADRRDLFDEEGNLKPLSEIDDDTAKLLGDIEVVTGKDGKLTHKVKTWDKQKAMTDLFKHKGLFEKDNSQQNRYKELTDEELNKKIEKLMNKGE